MEPEGSLLHSQASATCPYPVPAQSSPHPHPTSWRSILILSTHLRVGLRSGLFPSGFPTKTLYAPSPHPYAPHAQPISFFSILSPAQYWVRSTDHLALSVTYRKMLEILQSLNLWRSVISLKSEILIMNAANNHAPRGTRTNVPSALAHTSDQCFSSGCGFDSREHFGESFAESVGLSEGLGVRNSWETPP